jgi:acylphosphatase
MGSESRVRLLVSGRVQGVGFRYAAREAASECGAAGWVRNLPDGTVEIVAQGSAAAIACLRTWAEKGPRHGRVERVSEEPLPPSPLTGFEIRR